MLTTAPASRILYWTVTATAYDQHLDLQRFYEPWHETEADALAYADQLIAELQADGYVSIATHVSYVTA